MFKTKQMKTQNCTLMMIDDGMCEGIAIEQWELLCYVFSPSEWPLLGKIDVETIRVLPRRACILRLLSSSSVNMTTAVWKQAVYS